MIKNPLEYLESLGFIAIDIDTRYDLVGENSETPNCYVLINFKRETILKWFYGNDSCVLYGKGLTTKEAKKLWELDKKFNYRG